MNIQEELERLTKNVYTPMVFYVPYDILEYIPQELGERLDEEEFFNTMVMIDAKGGISTLSGSIGNLDILSKSKVLKTNLLQLIELEGKIKKETFEMLMEEYLETLTGYDFIYTWMADHMARDIPEVHVSYGSYFTIQSNSVKEHLLQIKERFIDAKREITSEPNFDSIIESGKKFFPTVDSLNATQKKDTPQKSRRKKKKVLPTEEEVDKWLLETVFSVDFAD
jgi:hypothetical protein